MAERFIRIVRAVPLVILAVAYLAVVGWLVYHVGLAMVLDAQR